MSEATKLILILILSCLIVSILDKQTNFSSLSAIVTTNSRKSHLFFGFFVFIDRFSLRLSNTLHKDAMSGHDNTATLCWLSVLCLYHSTFARDVSNLWSPYGIGRPYIFSCCFFLLLLLLFSSSNLSRRRLDVYHTLTHGVALVRI